MALNSSSYKSIGAIVGVALVAVIFVTTTIWITQREDTPDFTTAPYSEPLSGVVFEAPLEWTVGSASTNTVQIRAVHVDDIQEQTSNCSQFSSATSASIQSALSRGPNSATEAWKKEFPGLTVASVVPTQTGASALIGVDTCNPSLTKKVLTVRGQVYQNDVEVRFTLELPQEDTASQQQLKEFGAALASGTVSGSTQQQYTQFETLLSSLR